MKTGNTLKSNKPGAMPHCEAAVEWLPVDCGKLPARAAVSRFRGSDGVTECHITVQLASHSETPLTILDLAWHLALASAGLDPSSTVFRRIFCSDPANQSKDIAAKTRHASGAVSIIGQTPLPSAKFALWSQHLVDPSGPLDVIREGSSCDCRRGALTHHWIAGLADPEGRSSGEQSRNVLDQHESWLAANDMTLAAHVVRTWWFARHIDSDYQGLVDARREYFLTHGLNRETHYIASTGIAGAHTEMAAKLSLDSYAIAGLRSEQVTYLQSPDHLCPTHDYGVTFERATSIAYRDRKQVYLSGTASIDRDGRIVHEGDVLKQLDRTLENIEALLATAGANTGDLAVILVYLRDPADAVSVDAALRERFGQVPMVLLHAPVCRPGWLIEIEGLAIVPAHHPHLPPF
jgi:enamine deaminase RidA (YjgF/YER057c/UK114 family)